jgi:hypothetical protein
MTPSGISDFTHVAQTVVAGLNHCIITPHVTSSNGALLAGDWTVTVGEALGAVAGYD